MFPTPCRSTNLNRAPLSRAIAPAFLSLLAATGLAVELPAIRLDTVYPPGGKAGTEIDVAVGGGDLDEAKELLFSHPGITAVPKEKRFIIKIAPEVPPGIYDVRVSGLLGISNPRAFVVDDLAQVAKPSSNATPAAAFVVALDSTVTGIATAAVADWFKFTAKKGQRLVITCATSEIDSRMTPVLTVLDANARELEASPRGGMLDFTAPADGAYLINVHDLTYSGNQDYYYRLTITTGPHIDFVFPPSGTPGAKGKFTLYGRNLPGGSPANVKGYDGKSLDKAEVEIDVPATADTRSDGLADPAAVAVDGFSYRLKSPHVSNPVFIGFASGPVIAEQEPNNAPDQAQKLTLPCEVAGQFFPAADVDTFSFDAKKGETWWIEVISDRLDLPTNPFLVLQREKPDTTQEAYGADVNAGGVRFSTLSNDPAMRVDVKEDGTYRLKLRDLFGTTRRDPRNVYRLVIRQATPDFRLLAVADPPPEKKDERKVDPRGALVRADGTTPIRVIVLRRDGFAGDIELHAEGLPPGVTCAPVKLLAGANEASLLLTGSEKPERWAGAIHITGKARIGDADVVREARGGAVRWAVADANIDLLRPRLTRDIAVAVSAAEAAPVSLAAAEDKQYEIAQGAKLEIPLKVTRRGEFKEALKLKALGAAGIETVKEVDVAADAKVATATIDLATTKLAVGEHVIHFETQTKGKFRGKDVVTTIFSAPIRVAVQPPAPPPAAAPAAAATPAAVPPTAAVAPK